MHPKNVAYNVAVFVPIEYPVFVIEKKQNIQKLNAAYE